MMEKAKTAYGEAGVDIDAGDALVEKIKPLAKATNRAGVMGGIGGFGALFDLKAAGFKDAVLVSSTDGVGTKLKIAVATGLHDTIGIDLVAMCVNDVIVQGAEPLFFLDYFATGRLENSVAETVIRGIADGCAQAGCALIGGETAEMPGVYAPGDYDLAGFTVGAVERDRIITGETMREGDIVLGLASSGVHSNGYSLVRRLAEKAAGGDYGVSAPFAAGTTLGQALLTPTKIYVKPILKALRQAAENGTPAIKGMAHITGGGLTGNIPRIVPDHLCVRLDAAAWPFLPVFGWLQAAGGLSCDEMARTFNCGIGMVVVCTPPSAAAIRALLQEEGERVYEIGVVTPRSGEDAVIIANRDAVWKS